MIPKIIHYCWFGGKPMPELAQKCIESWKKFLPDYELRLWNEDTFDINSVPYVKEAYEARKFDFVTDYIRLWALEREGGVYMDTDVEILRPLDDLMHLPAFTGYEASMSNAPVTGLMASAPHGVWVTEQLAYYDENRHFRLEDGSLDMTPNTQTIAKIMVEGGQGSVSALSYNICYLAVGILQKIASAVDLRVSDVSRVRDPNHGAECP